MNPIYLDYAATTPCAEEVAQSINQHLTIQTNFANPSSRTHYYGWQAEASVEKARAEIAKLLNAHITEIIFTSGASESNNIALANAQGGEIISSTIEHSSIYNKLLAMDEYLNMQILFLTPNFKGRIELEEVKQSVTEQTKMVSLMAVNNELGSINPIYEIGEFLRDKKILFHIDAAQAFGKIALDSKELHADYISICAHKIYGPKGIGALFVRRQLLDKTQGIIVGGGQERGIRGGTLPTHQIAGFGTASKLASEKMQDDLEHLNKVREEFLAQLQNIEYAINGTSEVGEFFPGILNLCFANTDSETLIENLPELAVSTGSACSAGNIKASRILLEIGLSQQDALSSLRFSFGRYTSLADAKIAGQVVQRCVYNLQQNKTN